MVKVPAHARSEVSARALEYENLRSFSFRSLKVTEELWEVPQRSIPCVSGQKLPSSSLAIVRVVLRGTNRYQWRVGAEAPGKQKAAPRLDRIAKESSAKSGKLRQTLQIS